MSTYEGDGEGESTKHYKVISAKKRETNEIFTEFISSDPEVSLVYNILEDGEAEYIIETFKNRLERSQNYSDDGKVQMRFSNIYKCIFK